MIRTLLVLAVSWTFAVPSLGSEDEKISPERAVNALQRAVDFFRTEVSVEGGYLWRYAGDIAATSAKAPIPPD